MSNVEAYSRLRECVRDSDDERALDIIKQELDKLNKIREVVEEFSVGHKYEFYQLPIDMVDNIMNILNEVE